MSGNCRSYRELDAPRRSYRELTDKCLPYIELTYKHLYFSMKRFCETCGHNKLCPYGGCYTELAKLCHYDV